MGIQKLSIVLISTTIALTGCTATNDKDCENLQSIHSKMVTSWNSGPEAGVEKTLEDQRKFAIEMSSLPIDSKEIQQIVDEFISVKMDLIATTNEFFSGNGSESEFESAQSADDIASTKLARICKWEMEQ
jgi:hypothetical protein